jgi:hypothetical protein
LIWRPYQNAQDRFAAVNISSGQPQRFRIVGGKTFRGQGFFHLDLTMFRTISFTENFKLRFRAEALNALMTKKHDSGSVGFPSLLFVF